METKTETSPQTSEPEALPQELLQGEALQKDIAAKKKLAQESAARVLEVLQAEFEAMEGVMPGLRGDYSYMKAFLAHAMTKH